MKQPPLKLLSLGFERYINFAFEVLSKEARGLILIQYESGLKEQAGEIRIFVKEVIEGLSTNSIVNNALLEQFNKRFLK